MTLTVLTQNLYSQEQQVNPTKYTAHNKGKMYIFWGGNRESYSSSDIHFKGDDYDFTLYDVQAHDKAKGWHIHYNDMNVNVEDLKSKIIKNESSLELFNIDDILDELMLESVGIISTLQNFYNSSQLNLDHQKLNRIGHSHFE